jgi:hypothetical protein
MSTVDLEGKLAPLASSFGKEDADIVVSLVASAALADGKIDSVELEALKSALEATFGTTLSLMVVKTLVGDAVSRIRASGPDVFATALGVELAARKRAEAGVKLGFSIAASSDGISDVERARLLSIGLAAGLTESAIAEIERESLVAAS